MTIRTLMVALALCLAAPSWALGQADDDDEETATDDGWGDEQGDEDGQNSGDSADDEGETQNEGEGEDGGEDAPQPEATAAAASEGERAWFFGPFARYVWVPSFMLELFLEQAPTLGNGSIGVIADYRSESGPTLEIGIGYTGYGFEGPMQAKGDPETDTEWIESDLGLIHLTGSVLWKADLSEKFAFEYGVGLDLGILIGDLVRTEAYKSGSEFRKCPGVVPFPDPASAYCEPPTNPIGGSDAFDQTGAHYNVVEDRVPPVGGAFMLPHLTLRYQPIPELALKLEAAYGIVQMWLGLSVGYAPNI
jgi:hypothetical protein